MPTPNLDVLFAVLPFAWVSQPVLAVSILKAAAERARFSAAVRYFNLGFTERIGVELYRQIIMSWGVRPLIGDWIFAESLFGDRLPSPRQYLAHLMATYHVPEIEIPENGGRRPGMTASRYFAKHVWPGILEARKLAPEFVEQWADEIRALEPRVVGFSSTWLQACSCLAVARRLKMSPRPPMIIVGGPNCHRELGWHWLRCFPWIDYVCTGEGEEVFPELLRQVLRAGQTQPIPGILGRQDRGVSLPPLLRDLDQSPVPDHSDYFQQLARSGLASEGRLPDLPLESSRGCWWGEKCQCTFCGDPPNGIAYRSKSAARVLAEIKAFAQAYRFRHFNSVDEALDKKHIGTVFARLAKSRSTPPFVCQVRADLSRAELRTLQAGGVTFLAPGIESLSTAVLRLMRKGTTALGNLQFLRWCEEIGIKTIELWRILYGIPGEPPSEYPRMAKLVPLLTHLSPPDSVLQINLLRFSPYGLHPQPFGLTHVRPWPTYPFVYPLGRKKLEGIAYDFHFDYADGRRPVEYTRSLRRQVDQWTKLWKTPDGSHPRLDLRTAGADVMITDTRPCATRRTHRLSGLKAEIYRECDSVQSLATLLKKFGSQASEAAVQESLKTLVANKLLIEDDGRYLSLALMPRRT